MRFTVYLSFAALLAYTQAAEIKSFTEVPVEIDTEAEADSGLYVEIEADA